MFSSIIELNVQQNNSGVTTKFTKNVNSDKKPYRHVVKLWLFPVPGDDGVIYLTAVAQFNISFTGSSEIEIYRPFLRSIFKTTSVKDFADRLRREGYQSSMDSTSNLENQLTLIYNKFKATKEDDLLIFEGMGETNNFKASKLESEVYALEHLIKSETTKINSTQGETMSKAEGVICLDNLVKFEILKSKINYECRTYYIMTSRDLEGSINISRCKNQITVKCQTEMTSGDKTKKENLYKDSIVVSFSNEKRTVTVESLSHQIYDIELFSRSIKETTDKNIFEYRNNNKKEEIRNTPL